MSTVYIDAQANELLQKFYNSINLSEKKFLLVDAEKVYQEVYQSTLAEMNRLAEEASLIRFPGERYIRDSISGNGSLRTLNEEDQEVTHYLLTDEKCVELARKFLVNSPRCKIYQPEIKFRNAPSYSLFGHLKKSPFVEYLETDFFRRLPNVSSDRDEALGVLDKITGWIGQPFQERPVRWALLHRKEKISIFEKHLKIVDRIDPPLVEDLTAPFCCLWPRFASNNNASSGISIRGFLAFTFWSGLALPIYCGANLIRFSVNSCGFYDSRTMTYAYQASRYALAISLLHITSLDEFIKEAKIYGEEGFEASKRFHPGHGNIYPKIVDVGDSVEWLITKLVIAIADYPDQPRMREKMIDEVFGHPNFKTYFTADVKEKVKGLIGNPGGQETGSKHRLEDGLLKSAF